MSTPRRSARLAAKEEGENPSKVLNAKKIAPKVQKNQPCLIDKVEAVALFMTLAIYFNFYNPIGELTATRKIDYADLIITKLDIQLPTVDVLIIPYVIAFFCPIFSFWYQFFTGTFQLGQIRRAYLVQILMITSGSLVFYYFPVSIAPISIKEIPTSFLGILNYRVVHTGMSLFCSFPSMHIGHAWYQFFYMREMKHKGWVAMCIVAWFQFPATVLTRAHILADLPAGFLLAYFWAEWVYVPMERAKIFEPAKNRPFSIFRAGIIGLIPCATFALYQYLLALTGWPGLSVLGVQIVELIFGK